MFLWFETLIMTNKQRMRHEQIARVKAAAITQWFRS